MYSDTTEHYKLPQYSSNDVPSVLDDLNEAYEKLDTVLYQHGEGMAEIIKDNKLIHKELTEIRVENNTLQQEIILINAKNREQDVRIDALDKAMSGGVDDPNKPDVNDPTYPTYITNITKKTTINTIYPVGMIVAFANTTDPNDVFKSDDSSVVDFNTTWVALDDGVVLENTLNNSLVGQNNGITSNAKTSNVTVNGTANISLDGMDTVDHVLTSVELPSVRPSIANIALNTANSWGLTRYNLEIQGETTGSLTNKLEIGDRPVASASGSDRYAPVLNKTSHPNGNFTAYSSALMTFEALSWGGDYTNTPIVFTFNPIGQDGGHHHALQGSASGAVTSTGTVNYNVESPSCYVRYWKRTA